MLGTVAGNLAITLGAQGGIYIGGGIVPRLGERFAASSFRTRFEQKGRFVNYLAQVPTFVITAEYPAFLGVSAILAEQLAAPRRFVGRAFVPCAVLSGTMAAVLKRRCRSFTQCAPGAWPPSRLDE